MKLARKLTLAVIAGILVIMAVAAVIRVSRETSLFEADMSRDHRFISHVLRGVLESVAARDGLPQAEQTLHASQPRDSPIEIRVVTLAQGVPPEERPTLPLAQLTDVQRTDAVQIANRGRYYTYMPLDIVAPRPLALELSEPLDDEARYIRSSVLNNALALCAIVFVCSILAIALGYVFVGRPMSKLTEKARRIGAGDLGGPLVLKQRDEIAEFAEEMNAMCDRLAAAHERLEQETTQKIAALEQLRHADRLRTVGQLASGIAHELGTPLNVVLGRARMILGGDTSLDEASENARIIADQATRMAALIRQLLDFARPRGPKLQNVDLRSIATQTVEMLAPFAEKRKAKLVVAVGEREVRADVDPTQIQQALTNLVVNAVQSMSTAGEVTITVGDRRARAPADVGGVERDVRFIAVRDQGEGIAAENLTRVFEPFFTTKAVGEGTGLGLSVTYGIVRDHDGWIAVESEPAKGSTFTMYIPPERREVVAPSNRPRASNVPDGAPRSFAVGK